MQQSKIYRSNPIHVMFLTAELHFCIIGNMNATNHPGIARTSAPDLKVNEWLAAEAERIHEKYGIHIARHRTDNKQFRSEILALWDTIPEISDHVFGQRWTKRGRKARMRQNGWAESERRNPLRGEGTRRALTTNWMRRNNASLTIS